MAADAPSPHTARLGQLTAEVLDHESPTAAVELAKEGAAAADVLREATKRRKWRPAALVAWAVWQHPHPSAAEPLTGMLTNKNQVAAYWPRWLWARSASRPRSTISLRYCRKRRITTGSKPAAIE